MMSDPLHPSLPAAVFSQLQRHVVHAVKASQHAAGALSVAAPSTPLPSLLPPSLTSSLHPPSPLTLLPASIPSSLYSSLISRLHHLLSHLLSSSPVLSGYRPSLSLLSSLFRDCLRSYLSHLSSFYVSLFSHAFQRRLLPSFFRRHPYSASLLTFLRASFDHLRTSTSSITSLTLYLLAPTLYLRLLARHTLALAFFFFLHVFYQLCVHPTLTAFHSYVRSLLIHSSYLRKEEQLRQRMEDSVTYKQWKRAANALDRLQGQYRWKEQSRSPHYDWHRIRDDLAQFRALVDSRDVKGIMTYSRARLYRNLVGINDRRLYTVLRAGTKRLIEEYISEVVRALQLVCVIDSEDVSAADKLAFFNETRHAFGRSALLLSGGATLGLYHTGVIKALHDNHLLPRVLSGASVGSIVVAMLGTRTDEEIRRVFSEDAHLLRLDFFPKDSASTQRTITRLLTTGTLMDINVLRTCVKANVPNLTFQEAYDRSGRIINIVVSPAITSGNQDSLRLLNYLTAPNVLVWSAALASCAIPGIYAPVELFCLDEDGKERKWLEGDVRWQDGSVQADLPMERLRELFNVNNFIVSQVNPHVLPFLQPLSASPSFFFPIVPRLIDFLSTSIKSTLLSLLTAIPLPVQSPIRFLLDQTYIGDVTITPPITARDYSLLLKNPDAARLSSCLHASEHATWKLMSMIRGACEIEMALDDGVRRMRGALIMQEVQEARKVERLSRVRSWSTDFEGRKKREEGEEQEREGGGDGGDSDVSEVSDSIKEEEADGGEGGDAEGEHKAKPLSRPARGLRHRRGARRPLRPVHSGEEKALSPAPPVRRRSAPAPAAGWIPAPSPLTHHHAHSQPASTHASHLHLPSTTQESAPYISGLDGKNAASAMAHRSTGESVAHAYVLAAKSMKREALKRGATDGPQQPAKGSYGSLTASTTPRKNSGGLEGTSPARARTPPAPSSDAALSYEELILSRQSSARLQQLLRGSSRVLSPSHTARSDDSAPSSATRASTPLSSTLPLPPGALPPSGADDGLAMTVPGLVQFRPVQRRHISTLDLQRLGEQKSGDSADTDEEEERGWNAMMARSSDSDDDDEEEEEQDPTITNDLAHRPPPTERLQMEMVVREHAVTPPLSVPPSSSPPASSSSSSRFAYLASLLPFQSMYRSESSVHGQTSSEEVKGKKIGQQQQQRTTSAASSPGLHSASHDPSADVAGQEEATSGAGSGRGGGGLGRGRGRPGGSWKRLPRTLSLSEMASDLSSIP